MASQIKVEFDVAATMRDGTTLRANVFRPDDEGSYPIALSRTPYSKDLSAVNPFMDSIRLARAGYIVVIQDVRGRLRSEGEWIPLRQEALDGYDTVEWAAGLPGSNGNVGMFGPSYLGFTQWMAAVEAPPHLKCIVPSITWADSRDGQAWRGGAFELGKYASWHLNMALDVLMKRHKDDPPAEKAKSITALVKEINRLRTEGYFALPLNDFAPFRELKLVPEHAEMMTKPNDREQNNELSVSANYHKIKVPAFNIGGWYDIFAEGTLQNFTSLRQEGATAEARQAKLLMGPWSHVNYTNTVGEIDFGFGANMGFINVQADLTALTQRWFDYWLKGVDNGVAKEPPVKLFIMGENKWRDENEYPLARTHYTPYYLHSGGSANTLNGDGVLTLAKPAAEPSDNFVYDPENPVITYGGQTLMNALYFPGVKNQRPIEEREDVLAYTTEALSEDIEVTGTVIVKLWASSDTKDTDFVARLSDVHPDGFVQNLVDGIVRARYRNPDQEELLEPGKVYEFTINLWSTANLFKAGHRMRLDVTSSCFPRWDRNPNTGEPFGTDTTTRPARQTIWHDAEHPSCVVLPVIPR
jgi:uncharacterized protein